MVEDTLAKIEDQLRNSKSLTDERRAELLDLVARLRSEMADIATTHREQAQSIARFTELSAHEATREQRNPELVDISIQGLSSSVAGFEQSHPRLVQLVNRIAYTLSSLGI